MSLSQMTGGYGLGPGEGEALWFNCGLAVLKATGDQTDGHFVVMEFLAPKGFASPLHIHRGEDEFFGPAGVEGFFREGGKPAGFLGLPPAGEQFLDRQALKEIGGRYNQEFVGPPLPPKD
jgi:hypothetical protein